MSARSKLVEYPTGTFIVISRDQGHPGWQLWRWVRWRRTLGRTWLLLRCPIASFRWAQAKRRAMRAVVLRNEPHASGPTLSSLPDLMRH